MDLGTVILFFGAIALGFGLLVRAIIRTQQRSSENDSSVPRGDGNYPPDGHA